jgi:hypothetical protein
LDRSLGPILGDSGQTLAPWPNACLREQALAQRAGYTPLSPVNVYKGFSSLFSLDGTLYSSLSTVYNDESCFVIIGIRDVGGLERAIEVSKHLRTLFLKTCDMLVD